ncbi:pyrokinin-1 receptor-like isoform X2 [Bombyx mandarina]|uniref:Pheromone biosynthesis activating neuropeptide receptor n=2 Tax=Bombyx TaxID=7090 RepID=Q65YS4_BOMMO|nr:pheromone biosynthesis activating neuropeptide receptor [Bombyx mori]XP_028032481.1 pyrokinin-1 receptor-like isoform X2 [Bombyx mandarina]AEX15640.1 pheromone biosynthesis activating neuropeptide receptor isoform C [Bombyx mori]BAD44726.1 pheromone biosynthesis activating neuropeptide receptor [Bombyx mori]
MMADETVNMEMLENNLLNVTNVTDQSSAYSESYPLHLLVPLSVTYAVIFIVGILGNTSTCVVIARNRSMHTATNFYLFSLAISDIILLVCGLPLELYRLWNPFTYPLGEAQCITIGLASETSANATVLTITAFTMERYIAICRPFMSHTMSKLSRAVRFIIAIWVFALCTAVPQAMQFGIVSYVENGQSMSACTVKGPGVHQVFVISSFVFFVVPMSVISVLYALIGLKLRTSRILHPVKKLSLDSNERPGAHTPYRNGSSQRRVIRMLVAVALSFFICWAPFHVQRLLAIYGKSLEHPSDTFYLVYIVLTFLSGVLYFLSTAINPFLYNIMSNKFRNAFKMTLAAWCGRRGGPRMGRSYSALLASQRQRAANGLTDPVRGPRRLRRLSTATTHLCDAPPRAQVSATKIAISP